MNMLDRLKGLYDQTSPEDSTVPMALAMLYRHHFDIACPFYAVESVIGLITDSASSREIRTHLKSVIPLCGVSEDTILATTGLYLVKISGDFTVIFNDNKKYFIFVFNNGVNGQPLSEDELRAVLTHLEDVPLKLATDLE